MRRSRHRRAAIQGGALLLATPLLVSPAAAQLGGSLTLSSQARLRGQAISDHRPTFELDLVQDSSEGLYLGAAGAVVATRDDGLKPLSFRAYAGFAQQLSAATTIDVGLVHSRYGRYSGISGGRSYTEAYLGIAGRNISGRLFLSPAYFQGDEPTLYMEVNGNLDLGRYWALIGHGGRLVYLKNPSGGHAPDATDWQIGLRRRLGRFDLEAAWTGHAADRPGYDGKYGAKTALVIALTFTL
ncbi:TorF family putative porin [Sphingobium sp. Sx8-8]|uniref:TorF family putative porin n=1 Tax=Sphingobium sp. Sx8-8 TaxID=2933617 RepID=UPI001F593F0A